jgi:hypothetical protein
MQAPHLQLVMSAVILCKLRSQVLEEVQYLKLVLEEARPNSQALDPSLNPLDLGNLRDSVNLRRLQVLEVNQLREASVVNLHREVSAVNLHREAVLDNLLNLHNLLGSVSLHKLQASVNQRHNLRDLAKQKPMVVLEDRHT